MTHPAESVRGCVRFLVGPDSSGHIAGGIAEERHPVEHLGCGRVSEDHGGQHVSERDFVHGASMTPVDGYGKMGSARLATLLSVSDQLVADKRGTHAARRNAPMGFQVRPTPWGIAGRAVPSHKSLAASRLLLIDGDVTP